MPLIKVKAVEGRVAREAPDGPFIPHDRFTAVRETNYIRRLIEVHEDLIQQPKTEAPSTPNKEKK